jgi:hypothetical protein
MEWRTRTLATELFQQRSNIPVLGFPRRGSSACRLVSALAVVAGSISAQNRVPEPPRAAPVKLELLLELPPDIHQEGLFSNTPKVRSQVGAVQFNLSEATLIAAIHWYGYYECLLSTYEGVPSFEVRVFADKDGLPGPEPIEVRTVAPRVNTTGTVVPRPPESRGVYGYTAEFSPPLSIPADQRTWIVISQMGPEKQGECQWLWSRSSSVGEAPGASGIAAGGRFSNWSPLRPMPPGGGDHLAFSLYGQTRFEVPGTALTVGGTGGQPKFTLRMSVNQGNGIVDVRNASGSRVQTLTCPLDVPPFAPGLETARKEVENSLGRGFVDELVAEDYNFDGYVDLRAPRVYAASFQNYCVWLYDPTSRTFVRDGVAQKMEELENFRVDRARQLIIAGGLNGGIGVHSEEYRIVRGQGKEPARLVPVQSCSTTNSAPHVANTTLVEYVNGQPAGTYERTGEPPTCREGQTTCDCFRESLGIQPH